MKTNGFKWTEQPEIIARRLWPTLENPVRTHSRMLGSFLKNGAFSLIAATFSISFQSKAGRYRNFLFKKKLRLLR